MESLLAADLRRFVSDGAVSVSAEDLEQHSGDALSVYRAFRAAELLDVRPQVVVRPQNAEQVAAVLAYASARGAPVVPYGGGTGVMGGAVPLKSGIVLDLKRLDHIVEVDPEALMATVEPGLILEGLARALETQGLVLGHDPWSLPVATVGGAISTNGVGYLAGKYGPIGDQVLGLEAVLASGQTIRTRGVPHPAGPQLHQLFVGAEGTLGVITQATLQVFPAPELRCLYAYRFPDFEAGFTAVREMHAVGLRPALVDLAEERRSAEDSRAQTILYLGFEGPREEVLGQVERGPSICQGQGGVDLGQTEAQEFWASRHRSGERYKQEVQNSSPQTRRRRSSWRMDYLHVALPTSRVLEYRRCCQEIVGHFGIPVREWSLWGRPEFFSFLIADTESSASVTSERMGQAVDALLMAAQDLGGTMEYCHGVGLKLAHLMPRELGPGLEALQRIKRAWDPAGILNPGKLGL